MGRTKIAPTSTEPVETMGRMALMEELAEWRRVGPSLLAVARAARLVGSCEREYWSDSRRALRAVRANAAALARLDRVSGRKGET